MLSLSFQSARIERVITSALCTQKSRLWHFLKKKCTQDSENANSVHTYVAELIYGENPHWENSWCSKQELNNGYFDKGTSTTPLNPEAVHVENSWSTFTDSLQVSACLYSWQYSCSYTPHAGSAPHRSNPAFIYSWEQEQSPWLQQRCSWLK